SPASSADPRCGSSSAPAHTYVDADANHASLPDVCGSCTRGRCCRNVTDSTDDTRTQAKRGGDSRIGDVSRPTTPSATPLTVVRHPRYPRPVVHRTRFPCRPGARLVDACSMSLEREVARRGG